MTPGALYLGAVSHHRLRPADHKLAYRIFSVLLDLDRLEEAAEGLRLFSLNRFNLFSFYSRDRGERSSRPLRAQVDEALAKAGLETGGKVYLLTMPRLLGLAFNPLSVYYCYGAQGALVAMIWEVDNTFGDRHSYLIPVREQAPEMAQDVDKDMFVSPFMDMNLHYAFRFTKPEALLRMSIRVSDPSGLMLTARHNARRAPLTDKALLRLFFTTPALPLRVIGGIHWEALKLWRKGLRLRARPKPPVNAFTYVSSAT